ncbi:Glycosyl transferase, family 35 [Cynara cardunculus var. scolymus]|uniref:Alpha-1,4 glucan phosphorylase n=1 Tax=Cynara cardunculus var. scolymus TaxID=59895 RepID=A0A103XEZ2_CYNCS|nr:Glycosyl transferase, family 35 [Cynara cardunculus var. scolymus]
MSAVFPLSLLTIKYHQPRIQNSSSLTLLQSFPLPDCSSFTSIRKKASINGCKSITRASNTATSPVTIEKDVADGTVFVIRVQDQMGLIQGITRVLKTIGFKIERTTVEFDEIEDYFVTIKFLVTDLHGNQIDDNESLMRIQNVLMEAIYGSGTVVRKAGYFGEKEEHMFGLMDGFLKNDPALSHSVRDRLIERWHDTQQHFKKKDPKRRSLSNSVNNLGIRDQCAEALNQLGFEYEVLAEQIILDGYQHEQPDYWLNFGNPWEIERVHVSYAVKFYGTVKEEVVNGEKCKVWIPGETGKELRLKQQYFFVSASLQDIIRRFKDDHGNFDNFPEKVALQLNDTHPSISIAELMRVLLDEEKLGWKRAWDIVRQVFSFTTHTVQHEALEKVPVDLMESVLPRHLQRRWIVVSNPSLCALISKWLGTDAWIRDVDLLARLREYASNSDLQKELQMNMEKSERRKVVPRVCIIGGKAPPGYEIAKKVIKLCHAVAETINNDSDVGDLLKLVFIPDYNVSVAELVIPGSDLSQHISTAGHEASGTGSMKFLMNGCLLLATADGSTNEIIEEIGAENMFIFGAKINEVPTLREKGSTVKAPLQFARVVRMVRDGYFGFKDYFKSLCDTIENGKDFYLVGADFASYLEAQVS